MSDDTLSPSALQAVREASDEELMELAAGPGKWGEAANAEVDRRARERAAQGLGGFVVDEKLQTDAIRLRRQLAELYQEADVNMRAKQPRFRRADRVLRDTEYLIGPDSPCSAKPSCGCPACLAYNDWQREDQEQRDAADALEAAAAARR